MRGRELVGRGRGACREGSPGRFRPSTALALVQAGTGALEADLTALLLSQREDLPRAANGQPMAPSDAYAAQVWKDLQSGRSAAIRQLLAVLLTNRVDGVKPHVLLAFTRRLEAILGLHEPAEPTPRPLRALNVAETRANHAFDLAQFDVIAREDDPDALARAVRAADAQVVATEAVRDECERRLTLLRGGGQTTARRRPLVQVVR